MVLIIRQKDVSLVLIFLLFFLQLATSLRDSHIQPANRLRRLRSDKDVQLITEQNRVIGGYLLSRKTDQKLNLSDPIDGKISDILDRNGPNMRPSRNFKDFEDLSVNVSIQAWKLLYDHSSYMLKERINLVQPVIELLLTDANVSTHCYEAVKEVFSGAKRLDSWAIKLINSWGDFPPVGLFEGTFGDIGSFHTCVSGSENSFIGHTHYCTLHYRPVMPTRLEKFQSLLQKEPNQLIHLFNKSNDTTDAFQTILENSQYYHYMYYKWGTCWPIACLPSDIQRVAKLLGRRNILMTGPVKCASKHTKDYEETLDQLFNRSLSSVNQSTRKLSITVRNVNDGIFIWKPHISRSQVGALSVLALITFFVICMTCIDLILNRLPMIYQEFKQSTLDAATSKGGVNDKIQCEENNNNDNLTNQGSSSNNEQIPLTTTTKADATMPTTIQPIELNTLQVPESAVPAVIYVQKERARRHAENSSTFTSLVSDCSIVTNAKQFFTIDHKTNQSKYISCLNGIKCITLVWLMIHNNMVYNNWSGFARTKQIEDTLSSPLGHVIFHAPHLVDTFLLLSGLLCAYTAFKTSNQNQIGLVYDLSLRWFRTTPQIIFVSLILIVLPILSFGPHWYSTVGAYSENCAENWWINLLHLQTFYKPERMCNPMSWLVSVDFIYYTIALILIRIILYQGHRWGILAKLYIINTLVAWQAVEHYKSSFPSTNFISIVPQLGTLWTKFTLGFVWKLYSHSIPFFLGFYLGYLMAVERKTIMLQLNSRRAIIGWFLTFVLITWQTSASYWLVTGKVILAPVISTIHNIFGPLIWSLALSWIIVACHHGYGGVLNQFLSLEVFTIMTRASYLVYLSHCITTISFFGNQNLLLEPIETTLVYTILGNTFTALLLGTILCIIFEYPWLKFCTKLFRNISDAYE